MRKSGFQRPTRKLTRLALSGSLIFSSVLGGWWIIESSKVTEEYLVTTANLASGSPITTAQTKSRELALFDLGKSYLRPSELLPGSYLVRPISAGEAIPKSAIGRSDLDGWSNLVVTPSVELSSQITPGSKVSIWSAQALDYSKFAEPVLAALDVEVVQVKTPQGNFQTLSPTVELRVPVDSIASLIRSIANKDAIVLTASGQSLAD